MKGIKILKVVPCDSKPRFLCKSSRVCGPQSQVLSMTPPGLRDRGKEREGESEGEGEGERECTLAREEMMGETLRFIWLPTKSNVSAIHRVHTRHIFKILIDFNNVPSFFLP